MFNLKVLAAIAVLAFSTSALAQQTPLIDAPALVGPPPANNSAGQAADIAALHPTVSAERLAQARSDQAYDPWTEMRSVLGERFTPDRLPRTARVLNRVEQSIVPAVGAAKSMFRRERPYVSDPAILVCDPPGSSGGLSPSYPSGHATAGWAWALVLAELIPIRAPEILVRGREFGDSRVICGFHYPSDVEASRLIAAGVVARLHADAHFRRDLSAARHELASALR